MPNSFDEDLYRPAWAKRTWSFAGTPEEQADQIADRTLYLWKQQNRLDEFMRFPASRGMPDAVKKVFRGRGLKLPV